MLTKCHYQKLTRKSSVNLDPQQYLWAEALMALSTLVHFHSNQLIQLDGCLHLKCKFVRQPSQFLRILDFQLMWPERIKKTVLL